MISTDSNLQTTAVARRKNPAAIRLFTLLELIIAMIVFALVAAALAALSNGVTKSWQRLQAEERRFDELMALDRTLDKLLRNCVPFTWTTEDNETLRAFSGEPDRLRLACRHDVNNMQQGGLRFISFEVRDQKLMAFYAQKPLLSREAVETVPVHQSVLAESVETIECLYADWVPDRGIEWLEAWPEERQTLPLAIVITVLWQDGRVESWVRRTAGNGFRERWGKWKPPTGAEGRSA